MYRHDWVVATPKSCSLMCSLSPCSSRDEATNGWTHANDARAPNDETTLQTHDGANQARNDPSRQIKVEMKLPSHFHIVIFCMIKYHRPLSLRFCNKIVCIRDVLLLQLAGGLAYILLHTGRMLFGSFLPPF